MSNRRSLSNASSKNEFIRSATKIEARNIPHVQMRGGYRL